MALAAWGAATGWRPRRRGRASRSGYVVKLGAPTALSAIFGYLPTVVMLVMVRTVAEPGVTGGAGMGVMYQNLVGVSTIIGVGLEEPLCRGRSARASTAASATCSSGSS